MFTSKLNTMTGQMDWEIQREDYDYQQELARAGFADMLHDFDRNVKYFAGLKKVVAKLRSENKKVHVLDIGTGTGLLSMMAVHCGADKVTACEAFDPMIRVAKDCIADNGMKDMITIIEKRSTDIVVGVDMDERANVLITEVFDTELIGEGAISTFNHALEHLLVKDCYVIPDNAIMYVQIIDSSICRDWNWLNMKPYNIKVPESYANPAGNSICDLQLDQFEGQFKPITKPMVAFEFSFSGKKNLPFDNRSVLKGTSVNTGEAHGVLMWWVCNMDWENEILMSCAPKWANHAPVDEIPWRDHWMQAVYFPKKIVQFNKDDDIYISCNHDEYSLWFDVDKKDVSKEALNDMSLGCTIVSRNRLAQINNPDTNKMFIKLLKKHEGPEKNVLIANDDLSFLPLLAAQMNFQKVYVTENNRLRKNCLNELIKENCFENKIVIIDKNIHELELKDFSNKIDLVLSELAFCATHLPWESMYFYYGSEALKKQKILNEIVNISPIKIKTYAIVVQFQDLHKIRSPVVETCGFSLKEFDKVILEASKNSDGFIEPHPLWEYPCYPLSDVHEVFSFDSLTQNLESSSNVNVQIPVVNKGVLNGIVLWNEIEYDQDSTLKLNTGLTGVPVRGEILTWNKNYKQAVQILDKIYNVTDENIQSMKVNIIVDFDSLNGKFDVGFRILNGKVSDEFMPKKSPSVIEELVKKLCA